MRSVDCLPAPVVTSPVPRDVWESVLKSDGNALVTQSLPWRDALFASGRYRDVSRLYEFGSGRRVVLPLARRRLRPGGAAVVSSWPWPWAVGGPICEDGRVSPAEAAAVLADVAGLRAVAAEVKLRHDAGEAWLGAATQFTVEPLTDWMLDLDGGFGDVWEHRFHSSVRRAVRKAERSGIDIEVDRTGRQLGVFFELYQKSVRRWAAMQHAPVWLTHRRLASTTNPERLGRVARCFGADCITWVARSKDGEPVASLIVLRAGIYAKAWQAAMDKELSAPLGGVSQLLDWLAVQDACQHGYRYYDLGYATPGSSLGGYKERLGALAKLHRLRLLKREGEELSVLPLDDALVVLDRMWDRFFLFANVADGASWDEKGAV